MSAGAVLGPRFEAALAYACVVHADQRRKGTDIPYVSHLLAVAGLVIEDGAGAGALDEDEAVAALLHDAAEDRGGHRRLADIEARFGPRVAALVRACSDSLEPGGQKAPWRERKRAYLEHLEGETDPGVLRISLADKVHNLRTIVADYRAGGEAFWRRFDSASDPLWYYAALSEILGRRAPGFLADELGRVLEDLRGAIAAAPDVAVPGARWARRGWLLAGGRPRPRDVEALGAAGVEVIVDLTAEGEAAPDARLPAPPGEHRRHPLPAGAAAGDPEVRRAAGAVAEALRARRPVYLHCADGGGRTRAVLQALEELGDFGEFESFGG